MILAYYSTFMECYSGTNMMRDNVKEIPNGNRLVAFELKDHMLFAMTNKCVVFKTEN
jgi:hypothetical protein